MNQKHEPTDDDSLTTRVRENYRPAVSWFAVLVALVAVEFGALMSFVMAIPWDTLVGGVAAFFRGRGVGVVANALIAFATPIADFGDTLASIPTLLSRDVIPNQGYNSPQSGWNGTFLGLSPAYAWGIRVLAIYAYGLAFLWWLYRGYLVYREHYRYADWTPSDDVTRRMRRHRWGTFGLVIVVFFLIMAVFAPALGTASVEQNIQEPYSYKITYYEDGEKKQITAGAANLQSASRGDRKNTGIGAYDDFDRFHPFGTMPAGKDLFTFMVHGARVSMFIGLFATVLSSFIALVVALMAAYYRGMTDLLAVFVSDSIAAMPGLLALIMLSVVLRNSWISEIYSGGLLLALIFGGLGWTGLWRSIRGPALQTAQNEWVDAAESFGEKPRVIVRKHITPYVIGYLLVYASMTLGGVIIGTAGLSFLGIGINPPTPEWGRAVALGQGYITSQSWHISILPGLAIVVVVIGFNALGDGVRDVIDPESQDASDGVAVTVGGSA